MVTLKKSAYSNSLNFIIRQKYSISLKVGLNEASVSIKLNFKVFFKSYLIDEYLSQHFSSRSL